MGPSVKKVILIRVENLPMKYRAEHGFTGKAVIEVSKNSPMQKKIVKVDNYTEYFQNKFTENKSPSEIRDIANGF